MKRANWMLGLLVGFAIPWAGCSQQATTVAVRSLERSGRASFVCLRDPNSDAPGQQLDACFTPAAIYPPNNYVVPHVIGLVTQTARGEVAVVDITASTVLDADPTVPGYNFLPMGALPTDIVSTPGGNASFVSSGDPLRSGIFAIPSSRLPYQLLAQKASLDSWPACSLTSVPVEMVVVADRSGTHPGLCDAAVPPPVPNSGYDLANETAVFGRLKIMAILPDARDQLIVIDAQELLARPLGSFEPCTIERSIKLEAVLPGAPDDGGAVSTPVEASVSDAASADGGTPEGGSDSVDAGADSSADPTCSGRVMASPPPSLAPHPAAMALSDDGRLFVSDDRASVIHVIDVTDPCSAVEKAPLLPYSAADPTRAVVSSAIAVSPLTSDMKRFVYAVDAKGGGNVMAFDVSADSVQRRPLLRTDRLQNPFEPPDRINFASPVQGLTFAYHEVALGDPSATGVVPRNVKCDPHVPATDTAAETNPYLPIDFQSGAQPRRLRGTFGFATLSSGRVAVIDVDDLDKECRRPQSDDLALGCAPGTSTTPIVSASGEASCNIVEAHRPRSAFYFANASNAGRHAPAMQSFPLLYDPLGTLLSNDRSRAESAQRPRLLGPSLGDKSPATRSLLASVTGSDAVPDIMGDPTLSSDPTVAQFNWVAFDVREPRAHRDQTWFVTYEGVLPGLNGRRGRLQCATNKSAIECEGGTNPSGYVLYDSSVGFCDQGAQGVALSTSTPPSGDIVQITESLPDPADPYWGTVAGTCSPATCEMIYGTADNPQNGRDLPVDTSYEDRLVFQPNPGRGNGPAPLSCCFPYPVAYAVRAGKQWVVTGSVTGYDHHVIPDPTAPNSSSARCILSCDPALQLRNGRATELPLTTDAKDPTDPTGMKMVKVNTKVPTFDDPRTFKNAQIRFVLWRPEMCTSEPCSRRDTYFSFAEAGGFGSIEVLLSPTTPVLTQSVRFVRGIGALAIPDAVSQGLMLFDLNALSVNGVRSFY